jgi:autotransporter-associated beta strand protein
MWTFWINDNSPCARIRPRALADSGGATSLTKTGTDTVVLSGANSYTGVTTLNSGVLRATTSTQALGTGVATLTLAGGTLHTFGLFRFAVYPRCGGRAPELDNRETLEWMGRFLGRIHAVGAQAPFRHRPALDLRTFGVEPRDWLLAHGFIPSDLLDAWRSIAAQALDAVRRSFDRAGDVRTLRLHGDCHAGNVLWIEHGATRGPHFVDFDDARTGPAVQDLWMLLSGDRDEATRQLGFVLTGYEDFFAFDPRELHLVEALRTLRLLHYSAWLAQRWDDPAFPAAFPWFNTQRYWQDRILELREQVALMDEPPLRSS